MPEGAMEGVAKPPPPQPLGPPATLQPSVPGQSHAGPAPGMVAARVANIENYTIGTPDVSTTSLPSA